MIYIEEILDLNIGKIILLLTVFILSVIYLTRENAVKFPAGPFGFPFIGNYGILQHRPHVRLSQLREKFGDIFSIKHGRQKVVVVCSFEGIMEGLVKMSVKMSGRPHNIMQNMFASGSQDRGITNTSPSMHYKIKKDFILRSFDTLCCSPMVEEIVSVEAEKLALFLMAHKKPCNLSLITESTMLRLMLYLVNGKLYQASDENFHEIWRTFRMNAAVLGKSWEKFVGFLPWRRNSSYNVFQLRERAELHLEYQRDIVNRHKDCFNPDIVSDIVDRGLVMMEQNEDMGELSQDDLDSLFVELCSSGYRQLTATLLWLVLYVAYFPDVQDKIYEELMTVVGKERLPKLSDQPDLIYTCAVILETQRLASVMPLLYPHLTTEHCQFMGYSIPKDTMVMFNIWSLHHDSKHWKHPMKFDPERFIEDGILHIPDHYLPFGDGLRSCPGEGLADIQLFIFVIMFFYHLKFQLEDTPDLEGNYSGFVLSPKPYQVSVLSREATAACGDTEFHEDKFKKSSENTSIYLEDC